MLTKPIFFMSLFFEMILIKNQSFRSIFHSNKEKHSLYPITIKFNEILLDFECRKAYIIKNNFLVY